MKRMPLSLLVLALTALPAAAHTETGLGFSTWAGFEHPFAGLDHATAMVAVGLWAATCGGKRIWAWPLAFVLAMIAGAMFGHVRPVLPFVEPAIAVSVLLLGLLIALTLRAPLSAGAAVVAVFAIVHGHAHGAEAPAGGFASYMFGFTAATAILLGLGIVVGLEATKFMDHVMGRRLQAKHGPAALPARNPKTSAFFGAVAAATGGVIVLLGLVMLVQSAAN